jgi:integrase
MFALRWTDIDFDSKMISVSKQWTSKNGFGPTKTRRSRLVPISSSLMNFLKEYNQNDPRDKNKVKSYGVIFKARLSRT